jgi:hypothetical protein
VPLMRMESMTKVLSRPEVLCQFCCCAIQSRGITKVNPFRLTQTRQSVQCTEQGPASICASRSPQRQQPGSFYPGSMGRNRPHAHCRNRNSGSSHTVNDNQPTRIEQPTATTRRQSCRCRTGTVPSPATSSRCNGPARPSGMRCRGCRRLRESERGGVTLPASRHGQQAHSHGCQRQR